MDRRGPAGVGSGERAGTAGWLVPTLAYVAMVGLLGVTTKLALDDLRWPELVVWTAIAYALIAVGLVAAGQRWLDLNRGALFAATSGSLAASALIMLFLALDAGEVSRVVPITSSYPVVTVLLAAAFLAERVDARRVGATVLVVIGVTMLSVE
jgi:transporter family protein